MARKKMRNKNDKNLKIVPEKKSILVELYENKLLRTKVDNALDEDMSYDYIIELCAEYDLELSKSAISRYKTKRREAIQNGWDLGEYIDGRKKNNISSIEDKEVDVASKVDPTHPFEKAKKKTQDIYDDIEVLDSIIQAGALGLQYVDTVDPALAIKAMETKHKITNGQLQGMSLIGMRELLVKQNARDTAITQVILEYIPEEKHEEVMERLEETEKEFYENLDLDEEDMKLKQALDRVGYSI